MSLSDDDIAGASRRRRTRPLGRLNAGVDHLALERGFEDISAPTTEVATDAVDHLTAEQGFEDVEAPPWPDTVDHLTAERDFEDLAAPAPPVAPGGSTVEMEAMSVDISDGPLVAVRFPFEFPLEPGAIRAADVPTQFRIRTAGGTQLDHKVFPAVDDAGVIIPHHASPRDPNGGYDPLRVTPLKLTGWVDVLGVTPGTPFQLFFDLYNGRTSSDLTGTFNPMSLADNGAKMQKHSGDTYVELAQDVFHTSPIQSLPIRCSKNLLQYMPSGVSYAGNGTAQPFVLLWNNRTNSFSFDTLLDRTNPNANIRNDHGDAGPPVETIAQCSITIPSGKTWRPGIDTFASLGMTLTNAGANGVAEIDRRVTGTGTRDDGRTLVKRCVLPAFSTAAKRLTSAQYLCRTRFLCGATTKLPVPVTERRTWGFPMSAPDETFDHDKMTGFNFGRRVSHRYFCGGESNQATYNVGALYAQRWITTGHLFWWYFASEACAVFDHLLIDTAGTGALNTAQQEPRNVGWQYIVAYALTRIARWRTIGIGLTAWVYESSVFYRMRARGTSTPNEESQSRRGDAFCLDGAAGCEWLGLSLPSPATTARGPINFASWREVVQETRRGYTNATHTDPLDPDHGKVEQVHSFGHTGLRSLPILHYDGTVKEAGPKAYHTSWANGGLMRAMWLATGRWTASERDFFDTEARAQIVRTEKWTLAHNYRGSPLDGPDLPLGAAEGHLYTLEENVELWSPAITSAQKGTGAAPIPSGARPVKWDPAQGLYVAVSVPNVSTSDGTSYEGLTSAPTTSLDGFRLGVLTYLIDTETNPADLHLYETYLLRHWKNARAYCTTPGGYVWNFTGDPFVFNGDSSGLGPTKIYGEAWQFLEAASGYAAYLRVKYPALV